MSNIRKNFFYLSVYNMLTMLLPLATSPILSRCLGATSLGIYSYVDSIVSIYLVFATTGVYRYGMREIAKVRESPQAVSQKYTDILVVNTFNICVVTLIYVVVSCVLSQSEYVAYFAVKVGVFLAAIFDNAFLYCGLENMKPVTIRDGAVKFASFLLIVILVREPDDLMLYFIIMTMSSLVPAVLGFLYARRYVYICRPSWQNCRKIYFPMVMLLIPMLASNIYSSMDAIMIGYLFGRADVGYYVCAAKALVPRVIITALGTAVCSNLTFLYAQGEKVVADEKFGKSLIISMIVAFMIFGMIIAIAPEFAPFFWGDDFAICAPLMTGFAVTVPIWTVGEVIRTQYLLSHSRDREYISTFVVGVAVNAVVNIILIPVYGAIGAVIGTIAAESAMCGLQVFLVRAELDLGNYVRSVLPYFVLSLLLVAGVRLTAQLLNGDSLGDLLLLILEGLIIYVVGGLVYESCSGHKNMSPVVTTGLEKVKKQFQK